MISTYRRESSLATSADGSELGLETAVGATPLGYVDHPRFFAGFLARPELVAAALMAVADVAASRYFDLSALRAVSLDPVVTASGDRLRFESFSIDNGVHARLDVMSDGIDSGDIQFGTTNVDINPPLRIALSNLGRSALVHLAVGTDELTVATLDSKHSERKVVMPDRWIRGFAETPAIAARMTARAELAGTAIGAFLNSLPRAAPGPSYYLSFGPAGIRHELSPSPRSVHLAGAGRLSSATRIARYASTLRIYGSDDGASGWVFELPGLRFTLLLSPEPYRGFSGEGTLLNDLARSREEELADRVAEQLAWEPVIDRAALAVETGLSAADVQAGLGQLATSGKVGFDLAEQAWFHRELPLDSDRVLGDNPRLLAARELVDNSAVTRTSNIWVVHSGDHNHYVDLVGGELRCSCQWWAKYEGRRGPCKHVLAVRMYERL